MLLHAITVSLLASRRLAHLVACVPQDKGTDGNGLVGENVGYSVQLLVHMAPR